MSWVAKKWKISAALEGIDGSSTRNRRLPTGCVSTTFYVSANSVEGGSNDRGRLNVLIGQLVDQEEWPSISEKEGCERRPSPPRECDMRLS